MALTHLFRPLALGPVELRNRIVSTAHQTTLVAGHLPTADMVAYHEARARGGAGMIVIEATAVHPTGRLTGHTLAGYREEIVAGYERIAAAVQPHGTRLFVQLFHGGRELITPSPRPPAVAPSAVPSLRFHAEPRALRAGEIDEIVSGYAHAATLAATGGPRRGRDLGRPPLPARPVHGARAQPPRRPLGARDEPAEAVVTAVRDAAPGLAVGVRLTADDPVSPAAAEAIGEPGRLPQPRARRLLHLPRVERDRPAAGAVRPAGDRRADGPYRVGPPLIATTRITDPAVAERAVAVGGRRRGRDDPRADHRPRPPAQGGAGPARVDPAVHRLQRVHLALPRGHADRLRAEPAHGPRADAPARQRGGAAAPRGGGRRRAGRTRGRRRAGGRRAPRRRLRARRDGRRPDRPRRRRARAPRARRAAAREHAWLAEDPRVELRLGTEAGLEELRADAPDAIVVATGARPYEPPLDTGGVRTVQAWDVLAAERPPDGRQVVVADWGGGAIGLDAAEVLAADGRSVRFVTAAAAVGETLHQYARNDHLARLYRQGAKVEPAPRARGRRGRDRALPQRLRPRARAGVRRRPPGARPRARARRRDRRGSSPGSALPWRRPATACRRGRWRRRSSRARWPRAARRRRPTARRAPPPPRAAERRWRWTPSSSRARSRSSARPTTR